MKTTSDDGAEVVHGDEKRVACALGNSRCGDGRDRSGLSFFGFRLLLNLHPSSAADAAGWKKSMGSLTSYAVPALACPLLSWLLTV
jgi:hypothetical protein